MTGFFNSFDQRGKNINCIHFRRYSNHLAFVHEFSDSILLGSIYKVGGGYFYTLSKILKWPPLLINVEICQTSLMLKVRLVPFSEMKYSNSFFVIFFFFFAFYRNYFAALDTYFIIQKAHFKIGPQTLLENAWLIIVFRDGAL